MIDRAEFEKWLSEFLDLDAEKLNRTRYEDEDGFLGYDGLNNEGYTEDADDLASMAIQAWQAAREQGGEAVESIGSQTHEGFWRQPIEKYTHSTTPQPADGWQPKPNKPGRYVVRGFDSSGTEALVCVAYDDDQLVCNLHDSNSDPLHKFSNLMSEISDKFEWLGLRPAPPEQGAE